MTRTSRADAGAPERFDAIVVGSGFGGAVSAARLAQAGLRVAVVERGRRWTAGSFPRDASGLDHRWLWEKDRGLYDVRWLDHMISVQGAGWGGGSLVYANVFARPPAEVFETDWPDGYSRSLLDPYYDLVGHMLEVSQVKTDPSTGSAPSRTVLLETLAERLSRSSGTVRPQLAVRFADHDSPAMNRHGREQRGCTFVGECVLGCNVGAKNTLDYNYLAVAEDHGAVAITDRIVDAVRAAPEGFTLATRDAESGETSELAAATVILAAGAVGTTELLLRCRDLDRGLPLLSRTLGEGFSGNGDYLAFLRGRRLPEDVDRGPTITTTTIVDFDLRGEQVWFQAQDGGYPRVLAELAANLDPLHDQRIRASALVATALAKVGRALPEPRAVTSLLLMGRDTSDGRLSLDHNGEARVEWSNKLNRALYRSEGQVARLIARTLQLVASPSPAWRFLRQAITVHNLGGVRFGSSVADGVIDAHGEVFGYPGLFVMDGSMLPRATGVNPSATVAAVAERNIEHLIRRLTADPEWRAPETATVTPLAVPEDAAMLAFHADRTRRSGDGVVFRERLSGRVQMESGSSGLRMALRCELPGWTQFSKDPRRVLEVTGLATLSGVAGVMSVRGTLELFPEQSAEAMRYRLELTDARGVRRLVEASKTQHSRSPLALWPDLTTMTLQLTGPHSNRSAGSARIRANDVPRLVGSIRGRAFTAPRRVRSVLRFLAYFTASALGVRRSLSGHD